MIGIFQFLVLTLVLVLLVDCSSKPKKTETATTNIEEAKSAGASSEKNSSAANPNDVMATSEVPKGATLTLKEAIQKSLENNLEIKKKRFELAKADSDYLKNESRYAFRALAGAEIQESRLPFNLNNVFTGTKSQTNIYSAGLDKTIQTTGTYFKLEGKSTRFDSNAFENQFRNPAGFGGLALPPLYTEALTLTISQDLLKNSFGIQDRNNEKILKHQVEILRGNIKNEIANQVVQSLLDYWNVSIQEKTLETYSKLKENSKNIRDLTIKKQGLGLSEGFEVNQWNALFTATETQMQNAIIQRDDAKRKLVRSLNLNSTDDVNLVIPPLSTELPENLNYEADLKYAYENRADFSSVRRRKEIAELSMSSAKSNALPSLKANGSYGFQSQNLASPQRGWTSDTTGPLPNQQGYGVLNQINPLNTEVNKFPTMQGSLQATYPIADPGVKAGLRDAEINKRQAILEENDLVKLVADDLKSKLEILQTSFRAMKNAEKTEEESQKYYNGILRSYRQGRFNAIAVKTALDSLVNDQLSAIQAKVNYNINLHRYYIAKNSLFNVYNIDTEKLIPSGDEP